MMSLADRDCFLERIKNDKAAIALDLAEVRAIDNRLADEWGIRFPGSVIRRGVEHVGVVKEHLQRELLGFPTG